MQLNLPDLGFVNKFLNMTPRAKATKEKIENLGYIKMKNFCASRMWKDNLHRENIVSYIADKGLE